MAKFITCFPIGSMSGDNAYLGLSPDSAKGRIISTLDQNIVYRIELSNQKQIQSWTSEQKLSQKVVYDFKSQKYVGVFDNRKLGCWGEETTKIEKGKIKLPRQLKEIISFDDKHTILVYEDGTCESLENRVNGRPFYFEPIVTADTNQISRIECFNTRDNRVMLTYFTRNENDRGTVQLVYFLLNDDDLTPIKSIGDNARVKRIVVTRDESKVSAFFVVEGDPFPSVMKIDLDKRIYMLPLNYELGCTIRVRCTQCHIQLSQSRPTTNCCQCEPKLHRDLRRQCERGWRLTDSVQHRPLYGRVCATVQSSLK
ncbi:hypothetical protein HA402_001888 [Bradysia odoriphaga]|nr:hypothetical protein HA402_001888 [Bradysia odoriphaga]